MNDAELLAKAIVFRIAARLHVERRAGGTWSVVGPGRQVLNKDGQWESDPLPSDRSDAFKARTRFSRARALRLAEKALAADPSLALE